MFGSFVIVETSYHWFQLLVIPTLFCISCGSDVNVFFRLIRKYTLRYKTKDRMLKALSQLDCGGIQKSAVEFENSKARIQKGVLFAEEIEAVIEEAMEDNAAEKARVFKKRQATRKVIESPVVIQESPQETKVVFKRKALTPLRL